MRLTVGPLPAAVYWRRRLVVLVGLAAVVLLIAYACAGDPAPGSAEPAADSAPDAPSATPPRPTTGAWPATPSAFTLPSTPRDDGSCTDAEMRVVAAASTDEVYSGQPVDLTITITNVGDRECDRDVGADVQELRLVRDERIIWSSDDCDPNTGRDMRTFVAGQQVSFTLTWLGTRSRTGDGVNVECSARAPEGDIYQLLARLGEKLSEPFPLRIKA